MSGPRWGDGTDDEPLGKALRNWRTAIGVAGSLLSLFASVFELSLTFGVGRGGVDAAEGGQSSALFALVLPSSYL